MQKRGTPISALFRQQSSFVLCYVKCEPADTLLLNSQFVRAVLSKLLHKLSLRVLGDSTEVYLDIDRVSVCDNSSAWLSLLP